VFSQFGKTHIGEGNDGYPSCSRDLAPISHREAFSNQDWPSYFELLA